MFKRGAFELDAEVCPIAIKYNNIFVDAFWDSRNVSFPRHLYNLVSTHYSPLSIHRVVPEFILLSLLFTVLSLRLWTVYILGTCGQCNLLAEAEAIGE